MKLLDYDDLQLTIYLDVADFSLKQFIDYLKNE